MPATAAARRPAPASAQQAEARLKAREDFLKLMSHEIRTPLNGVLGMLGLLGRTRLDGAQRAYLSAARESGEHLLTLVNDLLDFAKIEAGKLELDAAPVDPELLLQGVAELLSPKAHEKGVEVAWSVDGDVPIIVSDDGRLRQILFNLAGNAVKFTDAGGVRITVSRAKGRPKKTEARLRFSVRDTGPGVPDDARARIFEEFGHADPQHAIRHGGAGLGLAICRRLVEALDGELGVDSKPGEGSTFWFEATFPSQPVERLPTLDGVTIAVAAASDAVRETTQRQIRASGGDAVAAASVEEAVAQAPDGAPVLIDHALAEPGKLVPRPQGRKALVLLRPEERDLIEKYRGLDYSGYLIKPLRRVSVASRLASVLSGKPIDTGLSAGNDDERISPAAAAGTRVLLVEDNPVSALLAQALLKREGCLVERAGSGEEALHALSRTAFDVVVMDVNMPGMDGMAATRALRARGDTTPVVALTAHAFEDDRRACLDAGMNDFLPKPFEPAALRASLARWTKRDIRMKVAV